MWDKQKEVFLPSTPGLGMHVEVKDPEGKVGPPLSARREWHGRPADCGRPPPCRAPLGRAEHAEHLPPLERSV